MRLLCLMAVVLSTACSSKTPSTAIDCCQPESESLPACNPASLLAIGGETSPSTCEEAVQLNAAGLWTNPNSINGQSKPAGALLRADNYTSNRPGEAEPVKGLIRKGYGLPGGVGIAALFEYNRTEFAWGVDGNLYHDTGAAYVSNGSAPALSGEVMKYATGGGDLYVTSAAGLLLADGVTGALRTPGVPRAYDIISEGTFSTSTADSPWLPAGSAVAYRVVMGRNDAEGHPIYGDPSGRVVAVAPSTGGPYSPVLDIPFPPGVSSTNGNFVRVYKTQSAAGGVDPGDTMFLTYERALTTSDDINGSFQFTDVDSQGGGEELFTNGTRGGVTNGRAQPPIAHDLTSYANRMWLANTQDRQRVEIRVIAPAPNGTYVKVGSELYQVFGDLTGGTVSQEIEAEARRLVQDINDLSTTYAAYYVSGLYDPPGKVLIENISLSAPAFSVQITNNFGTPNSTWAATFTPNMFEPYSSVADIYQNRVMYSVDGLPYAFPRTNTLSVGAGESPILRIVALRDSIFVFKRDDGLWKISGRGPFYVEQVNATARLIAPDSIAVVDNTIFGIADSGVIAVSEGGVETISLPIDDVFKQLATVALSQTRIHSRAIAREANTELKVYFAVPADEDSEYAEQTFEWNVATETWWRRPYGFPAGYTDSNGRLVLAPITDDVDQRVRVERSTGTDADYVTDEVDPETSATVTIAGLTPTGVIVPASTLIRAGQVLVDPLNEGDTTGVLEVLNKPTGFKTLVLNRPTMFAVDDTLALRNGVQTDIEWNTEVGVSPSLMKQWTLTAVLFQSKHYGPFPMTYIGDGWESRYGTQQAFAENEPFVRAEVPFDLQRSSKLNIRMQREVPGEYMRVLGMDATYRAYGTTAGGLKR